MHCDLFQIYCASPNLDITRTWICRLNFAQKPIFWGLRFFNEPEILDSGPPSLKSLPEDLCSWFLRPEKIHRPQQDLNPRTLDLEASTLHRDHRGRQCAELVMTKILALQCETLEHFVHPWQCQYSVFICSCLVAQKEKQSGERKKWQVCGEESRCARLPQLQV